MQCVFHSIRFKVNKVGIQRYPIFFALLSTRKRPQRKTLTSTKQTIYLWRNCHTPPPNHPKEERERNTHCANMQRRPEAKHCSSLCSQSEGGEDCDGQARAENPTESWADALAMFATCSWPSLCEQSELQCWRRNRRLCGPAQISTARALLTIFIFYLEHPKVMRRPAILLLFSERPPAFDCVSPYVRLRLVLRSVVPRPAFAKKYRD